MAEWGRGPCIALHDRQSNEDDEQHTDIKGKEEEMPEERTTLRKLKHMLPGAIIDIAAFCNSPIFQEVPFADGAAHHTSAGSLLMHVAARIHAAGGPRFVHKGLRH